MNKNIFLFALLLVLAGLFGSAVIASAQHLSIDIYFFKSDSCPYCKKMSEVIEAAKLDYPDLQVHEYDIVHDATGRDLLSDLAKAYKVNVSGVPMIFVGDSVIHGYKEEQLKAELKKCYQNGCISPTEKINNEIINTNKPSDQNESEDTNSGESGYGYAGWLVIIGIVVVIGLVIVFTGRSRKRKNNGSV